MRFPVLSAAVLAPEAEVRRNGDIIVTGERLPRTRHETASSVAVITADAVEEQAEPDRIEQLLQSIPNVQAGSGGEGPTIRGQDSTGVVRDLPAFLAGTRPRSTIQIDGRPATYYELAFGLTSIWDVERVELFRSPQTTTQGRNSIGGAIFVETRDPSYEWAGRGRVIAGDYTTRQASGVVSGPLLDDQLAMRLAGDIRRSRTSSRITSAAVGVDPNRDESELLRFKLLAEPHTLPGTRLSLAYTHGRSQMPQFEGVEEPFEKRRNPNATYGVFAIEVDSLTGRFSFQPSAEFEARATLSYGNADVRRYAPPGLGEARIGARDFSIEPVIDWRTGSGLRLTGGLHYLRAWLDQTIDVTAQQFGTGAFTDVQNSFGLFGEAALPLSQALTLTAGLRYQRDHQDRKGGLTGGRTNLSLAYDRGFRAWLPKFSIAWDASPALRIGALAQRAYNPGGVTINTARFRVETFGAERLWDYELFARARLADGKLALSANGFHYDITDAQRTQSIAFTLPNGMVAFAAQVDNAPRAWTKGLEFDAEWRSSKRLSLRGAIGLLDTRITRTHAPVDPLLGKQFQRSPRFTASAAFDWRPIDPLRLSAQLRHNSGYFSDDAASSVRRVGGSTTIDAKGSWTWRGLTLFGYVRNLFDEFHLSYKFAPSTGLATAGDPREFGIGVDARF